jgi:FkbM family methyltransferase
VYTAGHGFRVGALILKTLLKSVLKPTPYRVIRKRDLNRFEAVNACIALLSSLGFVPKIIVDGGAHLGQFALEAVAIFPNAQVHLIEPQPACLPYLERLVSERKFTLSSCFLGSEVEANKGTVLLTVDDVPTTGAHMVEEGNPGDRVAAVPVTTLDRLFAETLSATDRALLKLDLQGYELSALNGANRILEVIEVILTEVSFFAQSYEPPISRLIGFLDENGFDLFDIASISGRRRDNRARQGDFVFVKRGSPLLADTSWN